MPSTREDRTPEEQGGYLEQAVEAAHREISYPIGIVRSIDGGRSITRFALEKAEPFFEKHYRAIRADVEAKLEARLLGEAQRFEDAANSGQHSAIGEAHFRNKAKTLRAALSAQEKAEEEL